MKEEEEEEEVLLLELLERLLPRAPYTPAFFTMNNDCGFFCDGPRRDNNKTQKKERPPSRLHNNIASNNTNTRKREKEREKENTFHFIGTFRSTGRLRHRFDLVRLCFIFFCFPWMYPVSMGPTGFRQVNPQLARFIL